jgi:quercetin dioxygenase-like cupin family protein
MSTKIKAFAVFPEDRARSLNVVGEQITILASKAATHGYEIFLQEGPEGSGPPPHTHHWDESFYVIKGNIEFGIGDDTMTAAPGTLVHLPAGAVHWFRFGKGGGQMISMTSKGGEASALSTDIDAEIAVGSPDMEKLKKVIERNGVRLAGG